MIAAEDVPRLRLDEVAIDALVELSETKANRGVVLDEGHIVGILSAADLGRALEAGPRPRRVAGSRDHPQASSSGAGRRWA